MRYQAGSISANQILTQQEGEWYGYTYVWNDEQTDADLAPAQGAEYTYSVTDPEVDMTTIEPDPEIDSDAIEDEPTEDPEATETDEEPATGEDATETEDEPSQVESRIDHRHAGAAGVAGAGRRAPAHQAARCG